MAENYIDKIEVDGVERPIRDTSGSVRYDAAQSLSDAQKTQARTNINGAPGGFGLGTISQTVTDFDTVKLNGWYYGAAGTAHAPDSEHDWSVNVTNLGNNNDLCVQEAYTLLTVNEYLHCRRLVYVNTTVQDNPWEWVNPPMYLGVEYCTIERYMGKPVYVKMVDFGALPANSKKVVAHGIDNLGYVLDYYGSAGYWVVSSIPWISNIVFTNTNIEITTNADEGAYAAKIILKYFKTTD